ncbi:MAG: CRISPR-associated endonuclease Cas3'' [Candidatus Methanoplasma sp.]|jgi:CRISPR-associated endonuclease/helicase Cas3|nr:CRISPR-associated endonuclease Cas3'' [Candidatus Methanoplasma sp.]
MNRAGSDIVGCIAHIRESTGDVQRLEDHLRNTAYFAEINCSKIGLESVGRYIGLLHDFGKATSLFREYILGHSSAGRGDIDHSTAGAQYIIETAASSI